MRYLDEKSFQKHSSALLIVSPDTLKVSGVNGEFERVFRLNSSDVMDIDIEEICGDRIQKAVSRISGDTGFPLVTVEDVVKGRDNAKVKDYPAKANIFRHEDKEEASSNVIIQLKPLQVGRKPGENQKSRFFNHLLYHFPDTIYFKDRESRFLLVNSKQAEILGIDDSADAIGKTDFDFFPEEEAQDSYEDEQYIIQTGDSVEDKRERVTLKEGKEYWASTTKVPLRNESGDIIGTLGISRDITEQMRLKRENQRLLNQERELRERMETAYSDLQIQKEQFQGAFEKTAIGMALVSTEGEFMKVNDSLCDMLGYEREELTSHKFQEITHPDDLEKDLGQLNQLLEGKIESYTMEKRYYHKKGDVIWAILSVSLVRDADENPLHFVSQVQDITERKEYEQHLNKSLEEKQVLLEEIHHRVKNNLASVSGILELQVYNTLNEEVRNSLQDAQSRIHTMALVHEQLYQHDSLSNILLGDYTHQLVETIHDSLNTKNKNIESHVTSERVPLEITEAVPCGLILNELITNVYKHGFKGKEKGNIWIDIEQEDHKVHIRISDDGVGLPDDFSLDNQDTLGVNLINTLVDQLDAEMSYKNDNGAHFELIFPISE